MSNSTNPFDGYDHYRDLRQRLLALLPRDAVLMDIPGTVYAHPAWYLFAPLALVVNGTGADQETWLRHHYRVLQDGGWSARHATAGEVPDGKALVVAPASPPLPPPLPPLAFPALT